MPPDPHDQPRHTEEECTRLLDRFLLSPDELVAALAPEGWSNPAREMVDLVGLVLWDVFSDNHTVFDADGAFDLGSFRTAAGFLAEEINVRYRPVGGPRDYLDFYMGTMGIGRRADLGP